MATTRKPTGRRANAVRARASAPKPRYVQPKKPVLSQRWLQLTALGIVIVGLVTAFYFVWHSERHKSQVAASNAKLTRAAQTYKAAMDSALAGAGSTQTGGQFLVEPQLLTSAKGLSSGSVKASAAAKTATAAEAALKTSSANVGRINVDSMLGSKGFSETFVNSGFNAQRRMQQALEIYLQMSYDLQQAAGSSGAERAYLLKEIATLGTTAQSLFADGYHDYVNLQITGHVYVPPTGLGGPGGLGGLPGGLGGLPGGGPAPSP